MTKEVLRRRGVIDSAFVRAPGPRLDAQDQHELATMLDEIADLLTAVPGARSGNGKLTQP